MPAELNVSISDGLMTKLTSLASDTQRTREELVAAAVERLIDDEAPWIAQLMRGLRESEAGMMIPHEEVEAWIDSLGTGKELPRPLPRRRTT